MLILGKKWVFGPKRRLFIFGDVCDGIIGHGMYIAARPSGTNHVVHDKDTKCGQNSKYNNVLRG
jgi:hypothetical protein